MNESKHVFRYKQLAGEIERKILDGTYKPGEKLPSIRKLHQQSNLSISTVYKTYMELETMGLIEARPKSGYYVSPIALQQLKAPVFQKQSPIPQKVSLSSMINSVVSAINNPDFLPLGNTAVDPDLLPVKHFSRILKDVSLKTTALKSLDRIINLRFIDGTLYHTDDVKALLDDYISIVDALLSSYEITGNKSYFERAEEIMNSCINKLWDDESGGFFDSEESLLEINIKGIEDVPHPSANSVAVKVFLKLYSISGKEEYNKYAKMILELFIEQVKLTGIHSGYYFCALNNYFNMLKLTINASPGSELARTAVDFYSPFSNIVYGEDRGNVIPCVKDTCFAPVETPQGLYSFLRERGL